MIEQLTLHKSQYSLYTKLFFPETILIKMGWGTGTPLKIKLMLDGFGINIHQNMIRDKNSIYLINKYFYTAPYISIPKSFNIIRTLPIICGYIIFWQSYPVTLNVVFPLHLRRRHN